jgi:hypothetical protein
MKAGRSPRAQTPPGHGGVLGRVSYPLLRTTCVDEPDGIRWIPGRGSPLSRYPVQLSDGGRARVGSGPATPRDKDQDYGTGSLSGAVTCAGVPPSHPRLRTGGHLCVLLPRGDARRQFLRDPSCDSADALEAVALTHARILPKFATHRTKPPSTSRCVSGSLPSARPPLCSSTRTWPRSLPRKWKSHPRTGKSAS